MSAVGDGLSLVDERTGNTNNSLHHKKQILMNHNVFSSWHVSPFIIFIFFKCTHTHTQNTYVQQGATGASTQCHTIHVAIA
jgi:hypothetical protein